MSEYTSHDQVLIISTIEKYKVLVKIMSVKASFCCTIGMGGVRGRARLRGRGGHRGWGGEGMQYGVGVELGVGVWFGVGVE